MHRSKLAYVTCSKCLCVPNVVHINGSFFLCVQTYVQAFIIILYIGSFVLLGCFFHGYKKYRAPLVLKKNIMSCEYQLTAKKKKLCHIIFHAKKENDNQGPAP